MSEQDLELERLRRAFAARPEGVAAGVDCPDAGRMWSAVHGELPPEDVRPLVAHLVECVACAEAWRLAREVDGRAERPVAIAAPSRRWAGWAALAAAVVMAAAASVFVLRRPVAAPEFREGATAGLRSLVPEAEPLPRSRFLLRWTPGPPNATYAVQVATERLEPIAEARGLSVTEYLVPPEKLSAVPAGSRLLWRVEAVAPAGTRLSSATFVSRVE